MVESWASIAPRAGRGTTGYDGAGGSPPPGSAGLLLEGRGDRQRGLVADQRRILADTEVGALDDACRLEAERVGLAERVHRGCIEGGLESHGLRDAVHRQVSEDGGGIGAVPGDLG